MFLDQLPHKGFSEVCLARIQGQAGGRVSEIFWLIALPHPPGSQHCLGRNTALSGPCAVIFLGGFCETAPRSVKK